MKTKFFLCALALFSFVFVSQAQHVDSRLWGAWEMQSATQTTFQNGASMGIVNLQKSDLIKSDAHIPQDLFLCLYFFDDVAGACVTREESSLSVDINSKGTFITSGNNLTINLCGMSLGKEIYTTHNLAYSIQDSELTVSYIQPHATDASLSYSYNVIFKQTSKQ